MKRLIPVLLIFGSSLLPGRVPEAAAACERCFGAGADSPVVTAIGFSMLSLLVLFGFVFGGIVSFFNQANNRSIELQDKGDPN